MVGAGLRDGAAAAGRRGKAETGDSLEQGRGEVEHSRKMAWMRRIMSNWRIQTDEIEMDNTTCNQQVNDNLLLEIEIWRGNAVGEMPTPKTEAWQQGSVQAGYPIVQDLETDAGSTDRRGQSRQSTAAAVPR